MFLQYRPDVTIAELSLPDGSGLVLAQKIRAIDSCARVILLSMSDDPLIAARAMQVGAHAYFTKAGAPCLLLHAVPQLQAKISQSQLVNAAICDPPPMNWSTLMYVFGQEKEDGYAEEETDAGGDCREAPTS